ADHLVGAQIAALDQAQRVEQMSAEHLRAAAIVGEGGQRFDGLVLALPSAEVAFQSPERRNDGSRHAEVLLLASKRRLMLLYVRRAAGQTPAREHLVGDFEEVLGEEALPTVDIDDALIEHEVRRGRSEGRLRNALGRRFLFEIGEPRLEGAGVAAI